MTVIRNSAKKTTESKACRHLFLQIKSVSCKFCRYLSQKNVDKYLLNLQAAESELGTQTQSLDFVDKAFLV